MSGYNPFSLTGKTILVTGASSGIGRGIAIACSKMGANIILNGRNESRLRDTALQLEGGNHCVLVADLNDDVSVKDMVKACPKLDGVVHCAGMGQRVLCKQLGKQQVDEVMDTNFKAPVLLQAELLRDKKISKGASIVFIASVAPDCPSIGNAVYSASKGALIAYAKSLMVELAPRMIRVNCISPAMVWTDLVVKDGLTEDELRADELQYPLKRYGKPEDVAYLAVYMLSDASAWMTGSNVKITGGF